MLHTKLSRQGATTLSTAMSGARAIALLLLLAAGSPVAVLAQATDALVVVPSGDVGVGTETPDAALHVERADGSAAVLVEETSSTPAARSLFVLENNGRVDFRLTDTGQTNGSWAFSNAVLAGQFIVTRGGTGVNEMILHSGGDMYLAGDIFTDTCGEDPCGADYVFDETYELLPLPELEAFVRTKRHLPNVPPASDLVGPVNVSKLQMTLLEKIEELTLYVIEQDRRNRSLEQQLAALSRELDAIRGSRSAGTSSSELE